MENHLLSVAAALPDCVPAGILTSERPLISLAYRHFVFASRETEI